MMMMLNMMMLMVIDQGDVDDAVVDDHDYEDGDHDDDDEEDDGDDRPLSRVVHMRRQVSAAPGGVAGEQGRGTAHRAGAEGRAAQGQQGTRHRLHLRSVSTVHSVSYSKSVSCFSISLPSQVHSYQ
jgi:hypothetical protein